MATREELFKAAGIIRDYPKLDKYTEKSFKQIEEDRRNKSLEENNNGKYRGTSFYSSSFPDKNKPCARLALYKLMNIPEPEPISPFLRGAINIGHAVEYEIVYGWALSGITIGGSVPLSYGEKIAQLRFEDKNLWLTASLDSVLDLRPEYDCVLPVDIKSKKHDVVEDMKRGRTSYEEKHFYQVQSYIYMCNLFHEEMGWNDIGLKPAKGAFIYYVSRQDPRMTAEFYIPADWDVINNGIEELKTWQKHFIEEKLPERDKSWKWTEEPCKWCSYKKHSCKPDFKDNVAELRESNSVTFTKTLVPNYNFDIVKNGVLERWT